MKAGKKSAAEVKKEFLASFEGEHGNHDGVVTQVRVSQQLTCCTERPLPAPKGPSVGRTVLFATQDEWLQYYEAISCSIDSDDYFGAMIVSTWRCLKVSWIVDPDSEILPDARPDLWMSRGPRAHCAQEQKADGRLVPAVTYVSSTEVNRLEKMLRDAVFRKVRTGTGISGLLLPLSL